MATSQDGPPEVSTVGQLLDIAEQGRWLDRDGRSLVRVNFRDIDAFQMLLTRLGSRFGARFRDRKYFRRMVCTVAEHHNKSLPYVRRLGFGAFFALLEQVPEYKSKRPTAKMEQGEGDGGDGSTQAKQAKRGRTPDTDPTKDEQIAKAWKTRRYPKYEDLAREFGLSGRQVKCAIDRHRHRRNPSKRRKKSG